MSIARRMLVVDRNQNQRADMSPQSIISHNINSPRTPVVPRVMAKTMALNRRYTVDGDVDLTTGWRDRVGVRAGRAPF